MKKQNEIIAFLVIISIGLAAFFIPAVSADGEVYTEASVNPDVINLGESTTVTLRAVTTAPTAGGVHLVLPVDVEYVEGSASAEPIVNGQTLEWVIGTLTPPEAWDVSFDVTPLSTGNHSLNVVPDSEVIYGKVTGGGCEIPSPGNPDKKANFGFVAQYKDGEPSGSLQFTDHATGMKVHSESIDTLTVLETNATFTGIAKVNGASGYTFTVSVEDNGEPGKDVDKFAISIRDSDGDITYSADATLEGGNIQIHSSSGSVSFQEVEVFVEVKTPPVANFSWMPTEPHASEIATFDASASYDPDGGSIVSYNWSGSFGGSGETVTHVFGTEGNYSVTLTVTDDEGKTAEVSKEVTVISKPPGITITPPDGKGPYIGQQITIGLNCTNGVGKNASLTVDDECTIWSVESLPSNETNVTWIPMSSGEHTLRAYLNGTEYDNETVPIYIRKME